MRIPRLYTQTIPALANHIQLDKENSHYLCRVLRCKKDQQVILFNNQDAKEYLVIIKDPSPKQTILELLSTSLVQRESNIHIHLFQALSKGDKFEAVVQKATELGVNKITPVLSERVDYKLTPERIDKKIQHWQKIAISAAEQSQRVFFPQVTKIETLSAAFTTSQMNKLVFSPYASCSLSSTLPQLTSAQAVEIYIGPEGGFSDEELIMAQAHNCHMVSLGSRILRTETAPLAAIAITQAICGDLQQQ